MEAYGKIVNHVAVINTENRILYIYTYRYTHTGDFREEGALSDSNL